MRISIAVRFTCVAAVLLAAAPAAAQVVRVEIQSRQPASNGQPFGAAGPYEILRGRIHGEVDPRNSKNSIIQDLALAPKNARGRVEYVATFALAKPVDMTKASGVLVYTVVNRGNGMVSPGPEGHISLVSGWQGDVVPSQNNQTIVVPVARNADGSSITGPVIGRFTNTLAGTNTVMLRLGSMGGTPAYPPATLDQARATLTMASGETTAGAKAGVSIVPRVAWAFADCRTVAFPGTPDPTRLCVKDGFDPGRLYELVYTAKDPLVLGVGLAATRDIVSFFRRETQDSAGAPNPVAGRVTHTVAIGDSQSGNFIKTMIHLGFNQDLGGRMVWDGVFPRIAARQTPMNFRFALPGGAAELYEPGSEPALWWTKYDDKTRGRTSASLLDRCTATKTCPKVIEAFGSTEFWGLRISPGLVGTDAARDIPLPDNVRRYYYPGTTHGGGRGGFRIDAAGSAGGCSLAGNPNPEADTTRALTADLIEWVVKGTPPPPSSYPRLSKSELLPGTVAALKFPSLPGVPFTDAILNPVLDYDFGSMFRANDLSGVISQVPPPITQVIKTLVPRVDADGNENVGGVPSVLFQAPLGTYLGWNITSSGFFKGQGCGFQGGYVPFARTAADRQKASDPRLSVEERYGTMDGYICVVRPAVEQAVRDRFLLRDDADRLLRDAAASAILPNDASATPEARAIAGRVCASKK